MLRKFRTFTEAFTAPPAPANDNLPAAKKPGSARYRGSLPALRWLFGHDEQLAHAVAAALPKSATNWDADAVDNKHQIRPTVGELMLAASDAFRIYVRDGVRHVGEGLVREPREDDANHQADEWVRLGALKFNRGLLVEWGRTRKGKKLRPVDRIISDAGGKSSPRSPNLYLRTSPTTPSPMHVEPLRRPMCRRPVLPSMFQPQDGVDKNRALLRSLGVDGGVPFDRLPCEAEKCPTTVAKGAGFLGGISRPGGNASTAAPQLWEGPEARKGEVHVVVDEVAARGTLKSIGERLGFTGGYADRAGKAALVHAAKVLVAANDNTSRKKSAA
ncbi:MAG: hypothetical protein K5872_08925 [Rhizobiaceae bacterium]|nr:hypothetical protein [Rhizobiaceae bacterium]MCV0406338.1 hypothetical protein [Rhizobiaceae bacterium]